MMNATRISGFFFPLLFAAFAVSLAQPEQRGNRLAQLAATLQEKLQLSDEQTGQVKDIIKTTQEELVRDRQEMQGDRQMMMEILRERMNTLYEKIEALLTDAQKEEFAKIRKELLDQSRMRRGGQGRF